MTDLLWIIYRPFSLVLGAGLIYALVLRQLAYAVQPARLRMVILGRNLLTQQLSTRVHESVRYSMNTAFSPFPVIMIAFLLPIFFAALWWRSVLKLDKKRVGPQGEGRWEFERLWALSTWAANPLVGSIVAVELAVLLFLTLVFLGQRAAVQTLSAKAADALDQLAVPSYRLDLVHRLRA